MSDRENSAAGLPAQDHLAIMSFVQLFATKG